MILTDKRSTDTSAFMLMTNTVLFGVGAGLVIYYWYSISASQDNFSWLSGSLWSADKKILMATVAILLGGFFHSVMILYPSQRKSEEERIKTNLKAVTFENQAMTDPLTGIHNRRYFDEAIIAYLSEFNKMNAPLGMFLLDLDHFKSVNDHYGHDVGDEVLKEVAERLIANSREHDVVSRIGGEEFAVITPFANFKQLVEIAERYRKSVAQLRIKHGSTTIIPTVSIGIATNNEAKDAASLFKMADNRLYDAKEAGRNRVAA